MRPQTDNAGRSTRRSRSTVVALVMTIAALVLTGCPEDAAFQEEYPFVIVIRVPKLDHPQTIKLGPADVAALGLDSSEIQTSPGVDADSVRLTTELRHSTAEGVSYCFVEPVVLISESTETTIVEPGTCVTSGANRIDRSDTSDS